MIGPIRGGTKEIGLRTKCMARGTSLGKTKGSILGPMWRIRKKGTGSFMGQSPSRIIQEGGELGGVLGGDGRNPHPQEEHYFLFYV